MDGADTIDLVRPDLGPGLAQLDEEARGFASAALAPRTRQSYQAQWYAFVAWCTARDLAPLPAAPATVTRYLADRAKVWRVSSIEQALAAVACAHRLAGHDSPRQSLEVRLVMKGIRREIGVAPTRKAPAASEELRAMLATLQETPVGIRDRALLLLGWAGALRRSELVALDVADLVFALDGIELTLRRSKTDAEGRGAVLGIPFGSSPLTCPVRAVRAWLEFSGITSGPLFRSVSRHGHIGANRTDARTVAYVVKRCAAAAGLDASRMSAHSLRAGLITAAARAGRAEGAIARQSRHASVAVLRTYVRLATPFESNVVAGLL